MAFCSAVVTRLLKYSSPSPKSRISFQVYTASGRRDGFWVYARQQLKYRTTGVKLSACGHGHGTQTRLSPTTTLWECLTPPSVPPSALPFSLHLNISVLCFLLARLLNMQAVISPHIPPDKSPLRISPEQSRQDLLSGEISPFHLDTCPPMCGI